MGNVSTPGDDDYDGARSLWNGMIDLRPRLIARCESAADVAAAVRFGAGSGLELAIRGGGHSSSGASCLDDGLMIDLSRMNSVVVDPVAKTAVCGLVARWPRSTPPRSSTGSRFPAGRSATPGSPGSRSAVASAG